MGVCRFFTAFLFPLRHPSSPVGHYSQNNPVINYCFAVQLMDMRNIFTVLISGMSCFPATAQTMAANGRTTGSALPPVAVTKMDEAIRFDGVPDEPIWNRATRFPVTRQTPDYQSTPSEETDLRMFYNNDYIWFGARLYYKNTAMIQDYSKQRDAGGPMDFMAFAFDGYNDKTNGLAFATTPAGLRWDGAIVFNSTGVSLNSNWNTYWEVKTSRDTKGWYAEFKIPLSSLRFNADKEDVIMTFMAWRKIAYLNEFLVYPDIPPKWGLLSFANIAEGQPLLFKGIKSSNPLYITPYVLAGTNGNKVLRNGTTGYQHLTTGTADAGLDVKYSLSSTFTLDATFNTDFAQAEVDNFQVNLSRASLFFPEKREFFLERTGNFSFGFDGNNDVFYSRRIGLDNGNIARIYAGGRLTGRVNQWDIGLLNMQTEDPGTGGSKNLGLARIKRQVGRHNSYFGGVFTSSVGRGNQQWYTYGADALLKLPLKSYVKLAVAKAIADSNTKAFTSVDDVRLHVRLEIPDEAGFNFYLGYGIAGSAYQPALGFEERGNIRSYDGRIGYGFFPAMSKHVFKHLVRLAGYRIDGFTSGNKESLGTELGYTGELKNGAAATARLYYQEEVLSMPLVLSAAVAIPAGQYRFNGVKLSVNTATGKPFNASLAADLGSYYNGRLFSCTAFSRWDGSKTLQVQATYRYNQIRFGNGLPAFTNHLASLSAVLNFTVKLSINGLFQYDELNNRIGTNLRLRYNAKEGNDLFVVVTNINNTNRFRERPTLPVLQSWLALVKYKHTFLVKSKKPGRVSL